MTEFKGKSMKGATGGEMWNPTSRKIKGGDGKEYNDRIPNPEKGKEPSITGHYMGYEMFQNPKKPEQKPSKKHRFQSTEGEEFFMWGSHDLDKQLAAVAKESGLGTFCYVQWNGYLVKHNSKEKPAQILAKQLPEDFYHDWEVIAGDPAVYPPIKVEGTSMTQAPTASNVATAQSVTPVTTGTNTATQSLPSELGAGEEDDLPF